MGKKEKPKPKQEKPKKEFPEKKHRIEHLLKIASYMKERSNYV